MVKPGFFSGLRTRNAQALETYSGPTDMGIRIIIHQAPTQPLNAATSINWTVIVSFISVLVFFVAP